MALDAYDAAVEAEVNECRLQLLVLGSHYKANVHNRAVGRVGDCACEHFRVVDGIVKQFCFFNVAAFELVDASEFSIVAEGLERGEDG